MVLAVGEQHQGLVVLSLLERRLRGFNRLGQRRPAHRDDADHERIDALAKGVVIEREGTLQKRRAGEWNQREPVAFGQLHQIEGGQFGAREAIGPHVLGQHAA